MLRSRSTHYGISAGAFFLLLGAFSIPCHAQSKTSSVDSFSYSPGPYEFLKFSVSQDARHLLVSRSAINYEWDLITRQFVRAVPGRKAPIQLAADGQHAFYPNSDTGKIDILDLTTGQITGTSVAAVSPDIHVGLIAERHAGGPADKMLINIYEVSPNAQSTWKGSLPKSEGHEPLALSEHGTTLATLQYYNRVDFKAAANGVMHLAGGVLSFGSAGLPGFSSSPSLIGVPLKPIQTVSTTGGAANSVAQAAAGPFSYVDSRLVIWDVSHQRQVMSIDRPYVGLACQSCLALSAAGNLLIINHQDESLDAIDLTTGKKRELVKRQAPAAAGSWAHTYAVAISPDGSKVLRTQNDESPSSLILTVLDSSSGRQLLTIPVNAEPEALWFNFRTWFSPDGRFIAMANGFLTSSLLRVWDATSGQLIFKHPADDAVFASNDSIVIGNFREEVSVEHNLITGADEKFAEIPSTSRFVAPQ